MIKTVLIIIILFLILILVYNYKRESFKSFDGINSFDAYFYINLEHRTDRKKQITNELKKMNIPENKIIRIDAIREKYNGHIGCCKSHIKALKLAKKMNLNNVVIFEDDFVFTENKNIVDKKINHFLQYFNNFDIVQLTAGFKNLQPIDKYIKKVLSASTSSAYIINSKFYNTLIADLETAKNKMQKEMIEFNKKNNNILKKKKNTRYALDQHWRTLQKKSMWYIFSPYIGKQGGKAIRSSIMGNIESFYNLIRFYSLKV